MTLPTLKQPKLWVHNCMPIQLLMDVLGRAFTENLCGGSSGTRRELGLMCKIGGGVRSSERSWDVPERLERL